MDPIEFFEILLKQQTRKDIITKIRQIRVSHYRKKNYSDDIPLEKKVRVESFYKTHLK